MVLPALFGAATSILPSLAAIRSTVDLVDDLQGAFQAATAAANSFYRTVIGSNLELQQIIRQSSIVIAAQTRALSATGQEITDFDQKLALIGPRIKQIQREIEVTTRDIVGATDAQTNAILNQTINQFSQLQGQTREYADELSAIPDLVAGLTSAFNTFQIPDFQIPQEIRSLLQGDLNNPDSQLARQLQSVGLTKEAFKEAQAQGKLLDLLIEKTKAFSAANASGASTIENSFSIIKDVTEQFFRVLGEDSTEGLREGLTKVVAIINNAEFEEKANAIARAFGGPVGQAIAEAFTRASAAVKEFFAGIDQAELESFAENVGQTLGDVIIIATDLSLALAEIFGKIVVGINRLFETLEKLGDIDLLFNLKPGIINKDEAADDIDSLIDDFEKDLQSRGLLRRTFDFVVGLSTPKFLAPDRSEQIKVIKEVYQNQIDLFEQEIARERDQVELLIDFAPRIAAIDTEAIDSFKANGLEPIENEVKRLANSIDLSGAGDAVRDEIEGVLDSVSNFSGLANAQEQIKQIIAEAQLGTEAELQQFENASKQLQARVDAVRSARDELLNDSREGKVTGEVSEELIKLNDLLKELEGQQKQVAIESSPLVQAQRAVVAELERTGQSAAAARAELKELEEAAGANVQVVPQASVDIGNSLIKIYKDLNDAARNFADGIGNPAQIKQEVETLNAAVQQAQQLGTSSVESLINVLRAVATDTTVTVEQRLEAQQSILGLLKEEAGLKQSLLTAERALVDVQVSRGTLSDEQAAVESNRLNIKEKEIALQEKLESLAVVTQVREAGSKKLIEDKIDSLEKELQTASAIEAVRIEQEITQQKQLMNQLESGSITQQQLQAEIATLQAEKELLKLKENELEIDSRLAEVAQQVAAANEATQLASARRIREIAAAREAGVLADEISLSLSRDNLIVTEQRLKAVQAEIAAQQQAVAAVRQAAVDSGEDPSISRAKTLQLQSNINSLLIEEARLQAENINQRLDDEEQVRQALIQRQQTIIDTALKQQEANNDLRNSLDQVKQAGIEAEQAQNELLSTSVALAASFNNLKINNLKIELEGIDKIDDLENKLANAAEGSELARALANAIEQVKEVARVGDDSLQTQIDLIDRRAALEQQNANELFNLKLNELELERQIAKLQLDSAASALQAEQERLNIKNQELALEKQRVQALADSNQISGEDAASRIKSLDMILQANNNIAQSLDRQLQNNENQKSTIDSIFNSREQVLANEKESEDTTRNISTTYEKIERTVAAAADETSELAEETAKVGTQAEIASRKYEFGFQQSSGGSFDGGNIFGVEFNDFLSGYRKIKDDIDDVTQRRGASLATGRGQGFQDAIDEIGDLQLRAQREFLRAEKRYQKRLKEARDNFFGEGENNREETSRNIRDVISSDRRSSSRRSSSSPSRTRQISAQEQIDMRILDVQTKLLELMSGPQDDQIKMQIMQLQGLLGVLVDTTKSSSKEQTSVLEAINQNAFQNGEFKPDTSQTVFIDPATGELIISGTRPDNAELQQLIQLGQSGNNIATDQLTALNTQTSILSGDADAPINTPIGEDLLVERLRNDGLNDAAIKNLLVRLGVLTDQQSKLLNLQNDGLTNVGKINTLAQAELIDESTKTALLLRETLNNPNLTEIGRLSAIERSGFASQEEAEALLATLPSIEDLVAQGVDAVSALPSISELRQSVLNGVLPATPELSGRDAEVMPRDSTIERALALEQLQNNSSQDSTANGRALVELGVITETQRLLLNLKELNTSFLGVDKFEDGVFSNSETEQIEILRELGKVNDEQARALILREADNSRKVSDEAFLELANASGFSDIDELRALFDTLPSVEDLSNVETSLIEGLDSIRELRLDVNRGNIDLPPLLPSQQPIAPIFSVNAPLNNVASQDLGLSENAQISTANSTVVNNFYPDQAGSVNQQLRTAAL